MSIRTSSSLNMEGETFIRISIIILKITFQQSNISYFGWMSHLPFSPNWKHPLFHLNWLLKIVQKNCQISCQDCWLQKGLMGWMDLKTEHLQRLLGFSCHWALEVYNMKAEQKGAWLLSGEHWHHLPGVHVRERGNPQ